MAKRFTDTAKWDRSWYRKLSPKKKCIWSYLLDKCDGAGVWTVDLEAMAFHIGEEISKEDLEPFAEKLKWLSFDKILILSFIEFQYGTLSDDCKPHKPVIERLKKLNLFKGYQKGFNTLEDKEQDKDKEKDKEQDKEKSEISKKDLEELYALYPRKEGKSKGIDKAKAQIKTKSDLSELKEAILAYRSKLEKSGTEPQFIKHFDSFMTVWRDFLDPSFGETENFKKSGINWDEIDLSRDKGAANA